jgi:F-type H+-transporting ATPase subunit a
VIASVIAAVEFPPVSHLIEWPDMLFDGKWYAFNKIALLTVLAALFTMILFGIAARGQQLVPKGIQNFVEVYVEFIRDQIALQVMGSDGLRWVPLLVAIFSFVFFCNIFEVIPGFFQMPATARMAIPMFLALLVWVLYNVMGVMKSGPLGYFRDMIPPGVPWWLLPILAPIIWISHIVVQPFSLAVRLFANMFAGHLLLVTFAVLSAALFTSDLIAVILPLPVLVLVAVTGFELFVAVLQAYIFTILTAVYVDAAIHPHH